MMDNQHKRISGYRDLTQDEIDLMNEAKDLEAKCLAFANKVNDRIDDQCDVSDAEYVRVHDASAHRWLAIGKTDIETGMMALVRAIAQPQPRGEE